MQKSPRIIQVGPKFSDKCPYREMQKDIQHRQKKTQTEEKVK